ncbi:MAG TPA: aminodeoxychorismate synthase component I [Solimonas sp.]|nr:aminodeoxychorismate synthase component I [Solimonas sp.]
MSFRAELPGFIDLFELHKLDPRAYPFLLQSVGGHPQAGRYDILFAFPQASLVLRKGALSGAGSDNAAGDFFVALDQCFTEERAPENRARELPFAGGWFLLLGYEAAGQIENRLRLPPSPYSLPDAIAVRCPAAAIYDHREQRLHLLAESDPAQLERLRADVARCRAAPAPAAGAALVAAVEEEAPECYIAGVERVIEYLRAGDVFQVNLSRAWRARLRAGAGYAEVYAQLRRHNPAPFAGLACWEDAAVVSSSPERLIEIQDGWAQTRPIAGTRPRGADAGDDARLRSTLIASLKERAEHVMLIDLERNDLGRVCVPGSIEVSELMTVESYAHVHHIVSNVRGKLRPGVGPGAALRAVFPGGTITGCPKVRAMEIVGELEGVGRGPYTGAMGYLSRCGRLDTNILIRSLVCEGGQVSLRAGAGIVADSQPQAELAETRAKARGLLLALGAEV